MSKDGSKSNCALLIAATLGIVISFDQAAAQTSSSPNGQAQIVASEGFWERGSDDWTVRLMPYFWVPVSVEGDSTVDGGTVDLDLDLGDVLDLLEFGISGRGEAWKGKLGFIIDAWYVSLALDASPGPAVEVDIEQAQSDFLLGYQAGSWPVGDSAPNSQSKLIADVMGGLRYVYLKQTVKISPGANLGGSEEWVEPVVGARLILETSSDFYWVTRGDVSGFGIGDGSSLTWNVLGGLGYQPWERASIGLGYRAYGIDYSEGSGANEFGLDATLHGPYLTFVYQF